MVGENRVLEHLSNENGVADQMAKGKSTSNGTTGNGTRSQGASNGDRPRGESIPVDWEHLARATAHPLRVSILEILGIEGGRVLSPSDLSHELQIPLSNTNYHVTELAKAGLIVLVRRRAVRGATEHFYRLPGALPEIEAEGSAAAESVIV
jgi:DNA-binding transcriptional ArsR family regulator